MFDGLWVTLDVGAAEHDDEGGAGIGVVGDDRTDVQHLNGELFTKFSGGGLLVALAWLDLAAGEFPQSAMAMMRGPAGDKVAPVALDDSGDHAHRTLFGYHQK